jgi:hypothetical protein
MSGEVTFLSWAGACGPEDAVVLDHGALTPPFHKARIVIERGDEHRAVQLLEGGAAQVLVGEAALRDGGCIGRLAARYGTDRIGVYVPVRRAAVNWSLDAHSNADFTCLVSSLAVPRWDALLADGGTTGTDAIWWAEQMVAAGASSVMFATDLSDEDLLLAAECVERIGARAWFATRELQPAVEAWSRLAGASRFVVSDPLSISFPNGAAA